MKRSVFLRITALLSFVFGAMLFFVPAFAAQIIGIAFSPETGSVLCGMGGLILGSGLINLMLRNSIDTHTLKALLWTNIIINVLGTIADLRGLSDGVLTLSRIAPVQITHVFMGVGSAICLVGLKKPVQH